MILRTFFGKNEFCQAAGYQFLVAVYLGRKIASALHYLDDFYHLQWCFHPNVMSPGQIQSWRH